MHIIIQNRKCKIERPRCFAELTVKICSKYNQGNTRHYPKFFQVCRQAHVARVKYGACQVKPRSLERSSSNFIVLVYFISVYWQQRGSLNNFFMLFWNVFKIINSESSINLQDIGLSISEVSNKKIRIPDALKAHISKHNMDLEELDTRIHFKMICKSRQLWTLQSNVKKLSLDWPAIQT